MVGLMNPAHLYKSILYSKIYAFIPRTIRAGFLTKDVQVYGRIGKNSCELTLKGGRFMRIVSLKEDYVFKEFMSNEVVRKYFLSAKLGVPVESIRSVRLINTFLSRKWRMQKQGILDVQIEFNDDTKVNIEM